MRKSSTCGDECWLCGKELSEGMFYIEINLCLNGKTLRKNPYNRVCLECAIKDRTTGINFDNLVECAPKEWLYQVTALTMAILMSRE